MSERLVGNEFTIEFEAMPKTGTARSHGCYSDYEYDVHYWEADVRVSELRANRSSLFKIRTGRWTETRASLPPFADALLANLRPHVAEIRQFVDIVAQRLLVLISKESDRIIPEINWDPSVHLNESELVRSGVLLDRAGQRELALDPAPTS